MPLHSFDFMFCWFCLFWFESCYLIICQPKCYLIINYKHICLIFFLSVYFYFTRSEHFKYSSKWCVWKIFTNKTIQTLSGICWMWYNEREHYYCNTAKSAAVLVVICCIWTFRDLRYPWIYAEESITIYWLGTVLSTKSILYSKNGNDCQPAVRNGRIIESFRVHWYQVQLFLMAV